MKIHELFIKFQSRALKSHLVGTGSRSAAEDERRARERLELEGGSYWHQGPQVLAVLLAAIPRLSCESPLGQLPEPTLRKIAEHLPRRRSAPRLALQDDGESLGTLSPDGRTFSLAMDDWNAFADQARIPRLRFDQPIYGTGIH
jgi:hypothetical protein